MIVSLTASSHSGPMYQFSVLMLGQNFAGDFTAAAIAGWSKVKTIPPFDFVTALDGTKVSIGVFADEAPGDLGLRQTGNRLEVVEAARDNLRNYLAANQVREGPRATPATSSCLATSPSR